MQTKLDDKEGQKQAAAATSVDEDVAKMGVELTLLKSLKDGGFDGKVKEVMAKYGKIYLGVTVVISSFNYAVCYALVDKVGTAVSRLTSPLPAALFPPPKRPLPWEGLSTPMLQTAALPLLLSGCWPYLVLFLHLCRSQRGGGQGGKNSACS
jgi:hypothetical protein